MMLRGQTAECFALGDFHKEVNLQQAPSLYPSFRYPNKHRRSSYRMSCWSVWCSLLCSIGSFRLTRHYMTPSRRTTTHLLIVLSLAKPSSLSTATSASSNFDDREDVLLGASATVTTRANSSAGLPSAAHKRRALLS